MSSQGPPSAIIREAEKLFLFRRMGLTPSPSRYSNKNGNKKNFFLMLCVNLSITSIFGTEWFSTLAAH